MNFLIASFAISSCFFAEVSVGSSVAYASFSFFFSINYCNCYFIKTWRILLKMIPPNLWLICWIPWETKLTNFLNIDYSRRRCYNLHCYWSEMEILKKINSVKKFTIGFGYLWKRYQFLLIVRITSSNPDYLLRHTDNLHYKIYI